MKRSDGEKGATMVEIIMILGILGALSVSIATLVNSMYDRYRVSRVCGQIEEFKKLINNRYIADGRYSNVSVATVIEEGIAPKDMVSGKKLYHSYNGEVTVKGAADSYEITFADLPQKVCVELGILNWTVDNSSDLVSMNINGKSFKWPWVAGCGNKLPAQMSDVAAACKDGDENVVKWNFQ